MIHSQRRVPRLHVLESFPIVLVLVCAVLFSIPALLAFDRWLIHENGPIELSTFLSFITAGAFAAAAWHSARARGVRSTWTALLLLFGLAAFVAGLEEISWGQSFTHFASPAAFARLNVQAETNLHNLEGVQNLHSFLLFVAGVAGTLLFAWSRRVTGRWPRVPGMVGVCFAIVATLGGLDWWTDNFPFGDPADTVIGMLAEVNELVLSLGVMAFAVHARAVLSPRPAPHPVEPTAAHASGTADGI
jgi:hypothetical protein